MFLNRREKAASFPKVTIFNGKLSNFPDLERAFFKIFELQGLYVQAPGGEAGLFELSAARIHA